LRISRYILEAVQASAKVTIERDYEVICDLSNGIVFNDLQCNVSLTHGPSVIAEPLVIAVQSFATISVHWRQYFAETSISRCVRLTMNRDEASRGVFLPPVLMY